MTETPEQREEVMTITPEQRIEDDLAAQRKAETIACPHCGYEPDPGDIAVWAEDAWERDEPFEWDCYQCDTTLSIRQVVTRTYEVEGES